MTNNARNEGAENRGRDGAAAAGDASTSRTNVVPLTQTPRRGGWNSGLKLAALAASVAFIALVIWPFVLWNRNNAMRVEINRLSERNNELQSEVARLSESNGQLQTEFAGLSDRNNALQLEIARLAERSGGRPPSVVTPPPASAPGPDLKGLSPNLIRRR